MERHSTRHQKVNLTWFVGTGRTHSVQVKVLHLKALGLFAAVLLVWAVLSLYLIHHLTSKSSQLQLTLRAALTSLLDYQSRYDGLYELAYNIAEPPAVPAPPLATPPSLPLAAQPLNVRRMLPEPELRGAAKTWPLLVKRPRFTATGDEFVLQVQLRNKRKGKAVRGRIQAQAALVAGDGTELLLVANAHLPTASSGKYRIRNRKTQTFNFKLPPDSGGKISRIDIEMRDTAGKTAKWRLPIDLPYTNATSNITISKKAPR